MDSFTTTRDEQILTLLTGSFFKLEASQVNNLKLYDQALTHSSYAKEMRDRGLRCEDQERLEFLGDRVLNLTIAEYLFQTLPEPEGVLSEKIKVVQNENLAQIVKRKGLAICPPLLQLGGGQQLEDSILADTFESLIGAIYLDNTQGMSTVQKIIRESLSEEILDFDPSIDSISSLQNYVQQNIRKNPLDSNDLAYVQVSSHRNQDNSHDYVYEVKILGQRWGQGAGSNIQSARQAAAKDALSRIQSGNTPFD